jgi:hypothetical protein
MAPPVGSVNFQAVSPSTWLGWCRSTRYDQVEWVSKKSKKAQSSARGITGSTSSSLIEVTVISALAEASHAVVVSARPACTKSLVVIPAIVCFSFVQFKALLTIGKFDVQYPSATLGT